MRPDAPARESPLSRLFPQKTNRSDPATSIQIMVGWSPRAGPLNEHQRFAPDLPQRRFYDAVACHSTNPPHFMGHMMRSRIRTRAAEICRLRRCEPLSCQRNGWRRAGIADAARDRRQFPRPSDWQGHWHGRTAGICATVMPTQIEGHCRFARREVSFFKTSRHGGRHGLEA